MPKLGWDLFQVFKEKVWELEPGTTFGVSWGKQKTAYFTGFPASVLDFIDFCISKAHERNSVNCLITHGLDLITMIMPTDLGVLELKEFLLTVAKSLESIQNSTSLLFLRSSCDFFITNFPGETDAIKASRINYQYSPLHSFDLSCWRFIFSRNQRNIPSIFLKILFRLNLDASSNK